MIILHSHFVKCKQTLLALNSYSELHPISDGERKFCCHLFPFSETMKSDIFTSTPCSEGKGIHKKSVLHVQSCCFSHKNITGQFNYQTDQYYNYFLTFLLLSLLFLNSVLLLLF